MSATDDNDTDELALPPAEVIVQEVVSDDLYIFDESEDGERHRWLRSDTFIALEVAE